MLGGSRTRLRSPDHAVRNDEGPLRPRVARGACNARRGGGDLSVGVRSARRRRGAVAASAGPGRRSGGGASRRSARAHESGESFGIAKGGASASFCSEGGCVDACRSSGGPPGASPPPHGVSSSSIRSAAFASASNVAADCGHSACEPVPRLVFPRSWPGRNEGARPLVGIGTTGWSGSRRRRLRQARGVYRPARPRAAGRRRSAAGSQRPAGR